MLNYPIFNSFSTVLIGKWEKDSLWINYFSNYLPSVADGDSQEFQEVSRPVSWDKDYLTGSWLKQTDVE